MKNGADYVTRPFRGPSDFTCPIHGLTVDQKKRFLEDDRTGALRYAGDYMCCPKYHECRYWVSPFNPRGPTVAIPPALRDE